MFPPQLRHQSTPPQYMINAAPYQHITKEPSVNGVELVSTLPYHDVAAHYHIKRELSADRIEAISDSRYNNVDAVYMREESVSMEYNQPWRSDERFEDSSTSDDEVLESDYNGIDYHDPRDSWSPHPPDAYDGRCGQNMRCNGVRRTPVSRAQGEGIGWIVDAGRAIQQQQIPVPTYRQRINIEQWLNEYPRAFDNPQWGWANIEVQQWLAKLLVAKCGRSTWEAEHLAVAMFDHGFGPALFTTTRETWETYLGTKDGGSVYAWIVGLSRNAGAVPRELSLAPSEHSC